MRSWFEKAPLPYLRALATSAQGHLEEAIDFLPSEDQISDKIDRELRRIEAEPGNPTEVEDAVKEIRDILREFEKDRNETIVLLGAVKGELDSIESFDDNGSAISKRTAEITRRFVELYGASSAGSSREHDVLYRLIADLARDTGPR